MINLLLGLGVSSDEVIKEIVQYGQNEIYWDRHFVEWKAARDAGDLLALYVREKEFFQDDFKIITEQNGAEIKVSFIPLLHLYQFLKDVSPQTRLWLETYRKYSLENLVKVFLGKEITVHALPAGKSSMLEMHFLMTLTYS